MNGLELSEKFYEEYGREWLERDFPDLLPRLAVGITGPGSEVLGYDDDISRDHDFEPGFMIFLPDESAVSRREEFLLERGYEKLPREYMGVRRNIVHPAGGARHGIFRTADFFRNGIGSENGTLSADEWLRLPSYRFLAVTNGKIFHDGYGEVTKIRGCLSAFPEDIRLKRLAGHLFSMYESGEYNYPRIRRHGEKEAAEMAANEFVRHALSAIFLLHGKYEPYYKWAFRALREELSEETFYRKLADFFRMPPETDKEETMREITEYVVSLSGSGEKSADRAAFSLNERISDSAIRNLDLLYCMPE